MLAVADRRSLLLRCGEAVGGEPHITMKNTYRLSSTEMIYTPGIIRFAQSMFPTDAPTAVRILRDGYALPNSIAEALASGYLSYEIDGETVVFSTEEVSL